MTIQDKKLSYNLYCAFSFLRQESMLTRLPRCQSSLFPWSFGPVERFGVTGIGWLGTLKATATFKFPQQVIMTLCLCKLTRVEHWPRNVGSIRDA